MTPECDAFRHHAAEQKSGLTWNNVHSEEAYERTSHNFGRHLSAGISLDLGGAMLNIGTSGRYREYGGSQYGYSGYYGGGAEYGYPQPYNNTYYANRSNYSYNDYSYGYNGYANNGYFNNYNSSDYGRYYPPQQSYPVYASSEYDYNYSSQQQYYPTQNYAYSRYDSGYRYDQNPNSGWNVEYSSNQNYPGDYYGPRYSQTNYDTGRYDDSNYGNPFDIRSRRNAGVYRSDYSNGEGGYEYNLGQYDRQNYNSSSRNYADYDYKSDYHPQRGYYGGNEEDWQRMSATLHAMLGTAPSQYNRNVPDDLGCATVVSAALRRSYGLRINDTNVNGLENSLRKNGFEMIPIEEAQPGDCIIAHRSNGRHGHAAIYVGNGKIVNNSSAKGRVVVASLNNFASSSYESVVAYRRV